MEFKFITTSRELIIENIKNKNGFTLVELLLAIAIFGIVVTSSLVLAMDAYRSRANDRIRISAGLVIKDTINGLYSYKNDYWSEVISNADGNPKTLELLNNQYSISEGQFVIEDITYNMIFAKAERNDGDPLGEIVTTGDGSEPDTIKITITASWTDVLGLNQELVETYFFTNWDSDTWVSTTYNDFVPGNGEYTDEVDISFATPDPDDPLSSISLAPKTSLSSDWCTIDEVNPDQNVQSFDVFPTGNGSPSDIGNIYGVAAPDNDSIVQYQIVEPTISTTPVPTAPNPPANPEIESIHSTAVCEDASSDMQDDECEVLVELYYRTNGESWTNDGDGISQWIESQTPCSWYGVTCSSGEVTVLSLPSNNLSGPLIPEIGVLNALTTLNLSGNSVSSVIPATIGNLSNLSILNLSGNELIGKIPANIGSLSTLDQLYLQSNQLTCHMPPEIGNLSDIDNSSLNLNDNNLIVTTLGQLVNFFSSISASYTTQNQVIDNDECIYSAVYSDSAIIAQYNDSESQDEPVATEITLNDSDFPIDITSEVYENAPWDDASDEFMTHSFYFDGNDVLEVPASKLWNLVEGSYTVSMWIKRDGEQTGTSKLIDYHDTNEGWYLNMNTDETLSFVYESDTNDLNLNTATLSDNVWYHVAIVMDSGNGTIYLNGVSVDTDVYSVLNQVTDDSTFLYIGNDLSEDGFVGNIDEVRIYERALSADEIEQTRFMQVDMKEPGLLGNWRMDYDGDWGSFWHEEDIGYLSMTAFPAYTPDVNCFGCSQGPTWEHDSMTRYRINEIALDGNMVYLTTSNNEMEFIYFDKSAENITYQTFNLTSPQLGDPYAILVSNSNVFFSEGQYIYQYDKTDLENLEVSPDYRVKNMNIGCDPLLLPASCEISDGLDNVIDMVLNGDNLYAIGVNNDYNFGVLDVSYDDQQSLSSQTFTYEDLIVRNLYLDALL